MLDMQQQTWLLEPLVLMVLQTINKGKGDEFTTLASVSPRVPGGLPLTPNP